MAKSSESNACNDMYYEQVINVHLDDLVQDMRASDVCVFMQSMISLQVTHEVLVLEKSSRRHANITFLQNLLNLRDAKQEWFGTFIEALEKSHHGNLARKLQMKDLRYNEFGKKMLAKFLPDLVAHSDIDVKEVLLHLAKDDVIGKLDQNRIMNCHGIEAMWELLLDLPKNKEDWFVRFVHTLRKLNYHIGNEMISGVEGNSLSQLHAKLAKMINIADEGAYESDSKKLKNLEEQDGEVEHHMNFNVEGELSGNLYGANLNGASGGKSFEKTIEAVEDNKKTERYKMGVATVIRSCSNKQQLPEEGVENTVMRDPDSQNRITRCKVLGAESQPPQRGAQPEQSRVSRVEPSPMRVDLAVDPEEIELNLQGPVDDAHSVISENYDLRSERGGGNNGRISASNNVNSASTCSNNLSTQQNLLSARGMQRSSNDVEYSKPNICKATNAFVQVKKESSTGGDFEYQNDTVFIHGLPLEASINEIIQHFSMDGDIPLKKDSNGRPCAILCRDAVTNGPNGNARLSFVDESLAKVVIEMFSDQEFMGNKVMLEISWREKPRIESTQQPARSYPYDNYDDDDTTLTTENISGSLNSQSSTSSTPQSNTDVLELRSYQRELSQLAMEGKNCIIVAPTGSGKTHVALAITLQHFQQFSYGDQPKVIFFVPTVALVDQQRQQFERYLTLYKCIGLSGDQETKVPLSELLPMYNIFVMTPQILQNALAIEDIPSLSVFTLLIFDECHHATKSHTYNTIMGHYIDEMFDSESSDSYKRSRSSPNLPQVVGLTASVGVGKSKSLAQAVDNVLKLCANLHTHHICTVRRNLEELERNVNKPEEDTTELQGRDPVKDPFNNSISEIMMKIEARMKASDEFLIEIDSEGGGFRDLLQPPRDRGSDRYTQWIHKLDKPVASIYRQEIRRFFVTCLQHLDFYNRALLINADCRTKDALEFLENNVVPSQIDYKPYSDETDDWLRQLFEVKKENLREVSLDPKYENPKLDHLKKIILHYYQLKPDSRGIIFCKTRDLTVALMNWMKATEGLRQLNPHNLVGSNAPSNKFGMTQFRQEDVLRYFKDGVHKIIIATSVAEEGLDVQKCNFVIRYEHVTNQIARVQSRGRARDMDSKFVLVAERGRGTANKEECNKIRESLMMKAIDKIHETREEEIKAKITTFQKEARVERQMANRGRQLSFRRNQAQLVTDNYEIRCHKCDSLAAFSRDIRKIEDSHHVITDDDYRDRIHIRPHPDIKKKCADFELTGKIYCKHCNWDWGIMALYKNVSFPVIKICSFVLVDSKGQRNIYKRWKEVPFLVQKLKPDDLMEKARRQSGVMDDDDWPFDDSASTSMGSFEDSIYG